MAVYGDMLAFFPGLFREYEYFHMRPQVTASYSARESLGTVLGVFKYCKKGELKREEDTLNDVNVPTLWTRQKLEVGDYFIRKDDEFYRIVNPSDWTYEGGFNAYILETVVGNTDEQEAYDYVDLGQDDYA